MSQLLYCCYRYCRSGIRYNTLCHSYYIVAPVTVDQVFDTINYGIVTIQLLPLLQVRYSIQYTMSQILYNCYRYFRPRIRYNTLCHSYYIVATVTADQVFDITHYATVAINQYTFSCMILTITEFNQQTIYAFFYHYLCLYNYVSNIFKFVSYMYQFQIYDSIL